MGETQDLVGGWDLGARKTPGWALWDTLRCAGRAFSQRPASRARPDGGPVCSFGIGELRASQVLKTAPAPGL